MARCNCASPTSCGCALASGNSIAIANSGTPADPWVAEVILATTNPGLQVSTGGGGGLETLVNASGGLIKDANGVAVDPAQFVPRGTVGYAQTTVAQSGLNATPANLTGLTVTFTAVSGRRYCIEGFVQALQVTANGGQQLMLTDGAGTLKETTVFTVTTGSLATHYVKVVLTGISGSVTYKLQGYDSGGTFTTQAASTSPCWIMATDLGL